MAVSRAGIHSIPDTNVWYLQEKHQLLLRIWEQNWKKQQDNCWVKNKKYWHFEQIKRQGWSTKENQSMRDQNIWDNLDYKDKIRQHDQKCCCSTQHGRINDEKVCQWTCGGTKDQNW